MFVKLNFYQYDFICFSLPLKGSFHLSFTVLVLYRCLNNIQPWKTDNFHIRFAISNKPTRKELSFTSHYTGSQGFHFLYQDYRNYLLNLYNARINFIPFKLQFFDTSVPMISNLGFYHFSRRYYGNRCFFLFHYLIICLNSVGFLPY